MPVPWHPEPEALARYAGRAGAPGSEVEAMHRHVDTCPTCRTEWSALARFDFAEAMDAVGQTRSASQADGAAAGWLSRWLGLDTPMRGALAGAVVMAVVVLIAWLAVGPERRGPREVERFAERGTPPPAVEEAPGPVRKTPAPPRPEDVAPASGSAGEPAVGGRLLAETTEPTTVPPAEPSSVPSASAPSAPPPASSPSAIASTTSPAPAASTPASSPGPAIDATAPAATGADSIQLADAAMGGGESRAVPAVDKPDGKEDEASARAGREEVLLASLAQMPPPNYAVPAGATQLAWMHQFGSVRSGSRGPDAAEVRAHAPDHVGLTREAAPQLWWSLSAPALQPVTITLVDDREIDPLLEVEIEGPHAVGMHSISLADHGVELEPGVEYRWFVTLVVDAERPSRNAISAGSIKRVPVDAAAQSAIESADPAELGHVLARQGYWYDAYDFFTALSVRHPDVAALGNHRERLLADSTIAP
jgi:hypothetical protein